MEKVGVSPLFPLFFNSYKISTVCEFRKAQFTEQRICIFGLVFLACRNSTSVGKKLNLIFMALTEYTVYTVSFRIFQKKYLTTETKIDFIS